MNDYFGGKSREELELLLRRLISQGSEGPKIDLKRELNISDKAEQAEFAKDVSSIANTDDESHLDDVGYIIVGAVRGQLTGAISLFDGDVDKLQAHLTDLIKGYVSPVPTFSIATFDDPAVGRWGAIVIPPSPRQPHLFIRDGANVVKHEWWVRINDVKERAGPHDFTRVFAKATRREVRPLEIELQRLALRIEQRDSQSLEGLAALIRGSSSPREQAIETHSGDLASDVRRTLLRGRRSLEDSFASVALKLSEVMVENTDANPWTFGRLDKKQMGEILSYLEDRTFPLAHAMATVARYDQAGDLTDAVCRAFTIIARQPQPIGTYYRSITELRLYPVALCLYAITIVGVNERDARLLKRVSALSLEHESRDDPSPIISVLRLVRRANEVFNAALGEEYFEPVAQRVRDAWLPRFGGLLVGTSSRDAFYAAEFVLALAYLGSSEVIHGDKMPLPGQYLYDPAAIRPIRTLLRRDAETPWLQESLGTPVEPLLSDFDSTASKVLSRGGWADGFTGNALAIYRKQDKR